MLSRIPVVIAILLLGFLPALLYQFGFKSMKHYTWLKVLLWLIPSLFYCYYGITLLCFGNLFAPDVMALSSWVNLCFFAIYIPLFIFILFLGLRSLLNRLFHKHYNWLLYCGFCISILFFSGFICASTMRHDYEVREVELTYPNLPKAFNGYKIAQISDVHLGTLSNADTFLKEVSELINQEQVDMVCLTGDLLNTTGYEGEAYHVYLLNMQGKDGKFAVMGNHDYGTYAGFDNDSDFAANLALAHQTYRSLGYDLLLDEYRIIERDSSAIGLIGVENWSKPPFNSYGDLKRARSGMPNMPFNIVMTHDPNHWQGEILGDESLALTLSGHTHGAQIATHIFGKKWSPAQYFFPNWDGLYSQANQFLFVNRGLGYVGLPFRMGTPPEVTIITLQSGNHYAHEVVSSKIELNHINQSIISWNRWVNTVKEKLMHREERCYADSSETI